MLTPIIVAVAVLLVVGNTVWLFIIEPRQEAKQAAIRETEYDTEWARRLAEAEARPAWSARDFTRGYTGPSVRSYGAGASSPSSSSLLSSATFTSSFLS